MSNEAVIISGKRTPVGKHRGALRDWHPADLLGQTLEHLVSSTDIDPMLLDDQISGCVLQHGEQAGNIARNGLFAAGLPIELPATTIDRQCGSGQQAVHFIAQGIKSGEYKFGIGSGVESMSRVDLGPLFDPAGVQGPWYGQRALDRFEGNLPTLGPSIELVAKEYGFNREELDEFSVRSHKRAAAASEAGCFQGSVVPLEGLDADGNSYQMTTDEGIRNNIDPSKVGSLQPVFQDDGVITAANSSQISDGAAAVLLGERSAAEAAGLEARARIVSMAVAAADPILQFTAVIPAAHKALEQAGLTIGDIDLVEVNEAFAPVPLLVQREFGYPEDQLNVNGGSIAVGHPLGSTGARLITQLTDELHLRQARYGLLVICEGGGMANCTILERI